MGREQRQCRVWSLVRPGEDDPLEGEGSTHCPWGRGSCRAPPDREGSGGETTRLSHSVSKLFKPSAGKSPSFERGAPRCPLLIPVVAPAVAEGRQDPGQIACGVGASLSSIMDAHPRPHPAWSQMWPRALCGTEMFALSHGGDLSWRCKP